jgi:putative ABC transport system permease protein
MGRVRVFASRMIGLFRKRRLDENLEAEVSAHLEFLTEENIRRGMNPDRARAVARREFGGIEQTKEAYRDQRGVPLLDSILQDLRYGARTLRKNPWFTGVAVLTLALGIGANAAVFSLVDTILLHPLPYHAPEELVVVSETLPKQSNDEVGVAPAEYFDYRAANQVFSQTAAYENEGFNLTGEGTPLRVNAARLSASAFSLLGVKPRIGRPFTEEEDREGAPGVVLLSSALWENHYGADPQIVGKVIKLGENPYTVIGVMPASFKFPYDGAPIAENADLWVPEAFAAQLLKDRLNEFGVGLIGRLKPGVTAETAQADIESVAANFMRQYSNDYGGTVFVAPHVHPFSRRAVEKIRPLILLLQASVISILIIACANVANLLLAKAGNRSREMAVRNAIGAGPARLMRQCGVESLLLAFLGAAAGIAFAAVLLEGARRFGPVALPQLQDVSLNPFVFAFTLLLSVIATALFGLLPAWRMSHVDPQAAVKESAGLVKSLGTQRVQNALSVAEIALALVLLMGAGLLLQSFRRLLEVPMGFRPGGAVIVRTLFDHTRYPDTVRREAVQKQLLRELASMPGVSSVAAASHLPLSDARMIGFRLENAAAGDFHWADNSLVSPGYFSVMGTPLLYGRDFNENDTRSSPNVAVINETLAKQYFHGRDAIGQHYHWGGDRDMFTIIGVVADVRVSALDAEPRPMIYNSMFQIESAIGGRNAFVLRFADAGTGESAEQGVLAAVQKRAWSIDKDLPIYGATTLDAMVSASVAQRRFTMLLTSGFALIALLLAMVGLFGVVSYGVAQRTRELAVRIALGAKGKQIGWMILRQAAMVGLIGCGIGLVLFGVTAPLLATSLYQVGRFDPWILAAVCGLLLAVVLFAAYLPARRAMRVDPLVALRYE